MKTLNHRKVSCATIGLALVASGFFTCTHTTEPTSATNNGRTIFVAYDVPPKPAGGFPAIQHELQYPQEARAHGIEGRVIVQTLVDSTGEIVKVDIIKHLGYGCDQEAMRAILSQRWLPALQRDRPIKVWVSVPVNFELQE